MGRRGGGCGSVSWQEGVQGQGRMGNKGGGAWSCGAPDSASLYMLHGLAGRVAEEKRERGGGTKRKGQEGGEGVCAGAAAIHDYPDPLTHALIPTHLTPIGCLSLPPNTQPTPQKGRCLRRNNAGEGGSPAGQYVRGRRVVHFFFPAWPCCFCLGSGGGRGRGKGRTTFRGRWASRRGDGKGGGPAVLGGHRAVHPLRRHRIGCRHNTLHTNGLWPRVDREAALAVTVECEFGRKASQMEKESMFCSMQAAYSAQLRRFVHRGEGRRYFLFRVCARCGTARHYVCSPDACQSVSS